ncbi:integrase [Mesorhizobium loti]|uniref:Integrase n=2 Tax=Mesorhizobium jarvisii TaxID=1777867 RepID=A0A6M7TEB2_9HYPH|nr:integrase [Mesorhizobium loti]QKC63042.1 integrase [Mesorhizobium jarvisii]QKD08953.1 integrase [Mesorhizobium loti]RJT29980.1 integrase [Mesorhizobium jarvisii]
MAGRDRNLLNRDGRYFARLVVPRDLRPFMNGKTELRTALGPDYRTALKALPGAVAALQHKIALGERRAAEAGDRPVAIGRYPLSFDQIALRNYNDRLAQDERLRNADPQWASASIDDGNVAQLRRGMAGQLNDRDLAELVKNRIDRFRAIGNTTAEFGTEEWRTLARAICISEYEALSRVAERDEGDFTGKPTHPLIAETKPIDDELPPVPLKGLLADYIKSRKAVGKGREAERRWTPVFANLAQFIGHNDARRLTKQNLLEWRDARLTTLSAKTVADVDLASVRTVLSWAVNNDRLESNVAERVRQDAPKKHLSREKGFTLPEATAILRKARDYVPAKTDNARTTEASQTTAAKRWSPLLCAFTGARIAEITQLRKQDFRKEGETYVMRITPEAGTVKAGGYRDVPLHLQLVEMGFADFVDAAQEGPLFHTNRKDGISAARTVAGRVSQWLQSLEVIPEGVSPNHGWRHRFKTVGRELGISGRTLDAIQGHAVRTAGDHYGDVTIAAKKAALDKFPHYDLSS